MPVAASRKQYRFMMAILHGHNVKQHPRGNPPASIASKYTDPGKDAPESKDNDRGGSWTEHHHKAHKEKKSKKHLKKSFEEFYKNRNSFAATLVMDNMGKILLGTHSKGGLAFPGGHVEPGEAPETAALREMHEECGATGRLADKIWSGTVEGNQGTVWLAEIAAGAPKNTDEMKTWKWYEIDQIPWDKLRECCVPPLKEFIQKRFGKSIRGMVAMETLEKNIIRQRGDAVLEVTHGDALKLVGTGMFRHLKNAVKDMTDESFKELDFDTYKISLRKHMNDVYSGRVSDGHKIVYQWTNKSLPEVTAALMSVFEWYLPEDANVLDIVSDAGIPDDAVHGGLHNLVDNYKRHNLGEIYQEMETIREQIRNGVAVDLQQVEAKILKLFDRLEEATHELAGAHNKLAQKVGKDMDELEAKLRQLQAKLDEPRKSKTVEAFSTNPADSNRVHDRLYSYLTKPRVEISPNGKITISFGDDWEDMERGNFLEDMRARVIARK
jgi:8-oxo-dGTP pyrophosphatase MutT (NUDIX family)/Txe/YoeB family toxin of Txe-Axe toxin-antitoxin module